MAASCCGKHCILIVFGIIFTLMGFIMTMYGFIHTPFFSEDSWSDWAREDARAERKRIDNCKIVGPIFLVLGILFIVTGICMRQKALNDHVLQGVNATTASGGKVITYSATGNVQTGNIQDGANTPYQGQYPPTQAGYYPQAIATYPQQGQYPPQQQYPPPPQQQYPPPLQNQYPPPSQQQYPPPPQQQYQPPPQQQYPPQQPYAQPQQPYSEKSGAPGAGASFPPPPSYDQAASAPPMQ